MPFLARFGLVILTTAWAGMPVAGAMFRSGERDVPKLLLHALITGVLVVGLGLQVTWMVGMTVDWSAPILLALVTVINLAVAATVIRNRSTLAWNHRAGLAALVIVASALGSVYLVSGGTPYYGRAWGDQLNYSLVAHVLEVGAQKAAGSPARSVVIDGGLLTDCTGQSFLLAWTAEVTRTPVLGAFYFASTLGVLALCGTAYLAGVAVGARPVVAAFFAAVIALSPSVQATHLESFLSQTVVTPFVVYAVLAMYLAFSTRRVIWLVITLLGSAWTLSAYFEFVPLLIVCAAVMIVAAWITETASRQWLVLCGASMVTGLGAGLLGNVHLLALAGRIGGLEGFEKFFPWAYRAEGAARLLVGDGVLWSTATIRAEAIAAFLVTGAGLLGLAMAAWRRRNGLAWALGAAPVMALGVGLLPGEHSYPFYKLLQSFWPFVLIGAASLLGSAISARRAAFAIIGVGLSVVLAATMMATSLRMLAVEAFGQSPRSGMNAYLREYGDSEMRRLVEGWPEAKLVLNMPVRTGWNDLIANGVAALQLDDAFKQIEAKWTQIGDRTDREPENPAIPGDTSFPSVRTLRADWLSDPKDVLVLQIGASFVRPSGRLFREVRAFGRMHLFTLVQPDWLVVSSVVPPFSGDFMAWDDGVTVGNGPSLYLRMDFESSREVPNGVSIEVHHDAPVGSALVYWHVYSNNSYGVTFANTPTVAVIRSGPLRRGVTEVFFGPRMTVSRPDTRTYTVKISSLVYGG